MVLADVSELVVEISARAVEAPEAAHREPYHGDAPCCRERSGRPAFPLGRGSESRRDARGEPRRMRQLGERKPTHNADIVVIATRLKAEFASGNRAPRRDRDEQRRMMQFGVARACVTAPVGADPAGALGKPKRLAKARQSAAGLARSEEHTSELQSLMRSSYAVFC